MICVAETTVNPGAFVPARLTDVAPVKFVPVITTLLPAAPLPGLNPLIEGNGGTVTVKFTAAVAVPPAVVTDHFPVEAPAGTVAVTCVAETTENDATVPFSFTDEAPAKFVPVIVTDVPPGPDVGLNELIVGAGTVTVNEPTLVAVPPGVVTLQVPLAAPEGTVTVIWVAELTV